MSRELAEYLSWYFEAEEHRREAARHARVAKDLEDKLEALHHVLEASVSPRCGSAAQPAIRTFTNGKYQTIAVFWDGKQGRIEIQEYNKPGLSD